MDFINVNHKYKLGIILHVSHSISALNRRLSPTHGQRIYKRVMNPSHSRTTTDIGLSREKTSDRVDMYMCR